MNLSRFTAYRRTYIRPTPMRFTVALQCCDPPVPVATFNTNDEVEAFKAFADIRAENIQNGGGGDRHEDHGQDFVGTRSQHVQRGGTDSGCGVSSFVQERCVKKPNGRKRHEFFGCECVVSVGGDGGVLRSDVDLSVSEYQSDAARRFSSAIRSAVDLCDSRILFEHLVRHRLDRLADSVRQELVPLYKSGV